MYEGTHIYIYKCIYKVRIYIYKCIYIYVCMYDNKYVGVNVCVNECSMLKTYA
ncbi:hypothetical protein HanPI659440_Chr17g0692181 [Helianthus annuus]|nr:hypothetical protein HanPI659440_Chr17g0692181 [Helianthus annuus]